MEKLIKLLNEEKDFKILIQELEKLQITSFVTNAYTLVSNYYINDKLVHETKASIDKSNLYKKIDVEEFKKNLILHQENKLDFISWLNITIENGIKYWIVDIDKKKCIYYDINDNMLYSENI